MKIARLLARKGQGAAGAGASKMVWFVMLAPTNASPSAMACNRMPAVPSLTTQIWEFAPLILVFLPEGVKGVHAGKALSPSWSA